MLCVLGSWALWAAPHRPSVYTDFIYSLKGRKVRPAHCYRDSVGQDGSFGGDFQVSLQSLLVIAGAAYGLALCSHQTPSGRLLLVLGMSLSGRAG